MYQPDTLTIHDPSPSKPVPAGIASAFNSDAAIQGKMDPIGVERVANMVTQLRQAIAQSLAAQNFMQDYMLQADARYLHLRKIEGIDREKQDLRKSRLKRKTDAGEEILRNEPQRTQRSA